MLLTEGELCNLKTSELCNLPTTTIRWLTQNIYAKSNSYPLSAHPSSVFKEPYKLRKNKMKTKKKH